MADRIAQLRQMLKSEDEVESLRDKWRKQGVSIEQAPQKAVFGLTFVATDPDGHRIRVCLDG